MSRKMIFYVAFFLVLVLGFYVAMTKLLPGFANPKLPVLSYVQPFSFINQEGKLVTERDVADKVYVAEYFFTTCPNICPMLNNGLKTIYEKYRDEPGFLILSHTVDPLNDSAGRLKFYAD